MEDGLLGLFPEPCRYFEPRLQSLGVLVGLAPSNNQRWFFWTDMFLESNDLLCGPTRGVLRCLKYYSSINPGLFSMPSQHVTKVGLKPVYIARGWPVYLQNFWFWKYHKELERDPPDEMPSKFGFDSLPWQTTARGIIEQWPDQVR